MPKLDIHEKKTQKYLNVKRREGISTMKIWKKLEPFFDKLATPIIVLCKENKRKENYEMENV